MIIIMMMDERVQDNKDALRRAYHRQYYHDNKQPEQCPYCELMFSSHSAVLRHMKRNVKCILRRTINELKEIKENRE